MQSTAIRFSKKTKQLLIKFYFATAAGLQEGDELLGFIVRRGSEIQIIPLEDESMVSVFINK